MARLPLLVFLVGGYLFSLVSSGEDRSLRQLADEQGLWIGAAVNGRAFPVDVTYLQILGREFSMVTPENGMKFRSLAGEPG